MSRKVANLTNNARQQCRLVGDNGEIISFLLYYLPTQNGWAFDISYQDFVLNGVLLTISPNILRGYRNIIPFGITLVSTDGYEPQFINDFIDERVTLYLLNAAEVQEIEAEIYT